MYINLIYKSFLVSTPLLHLNFIKFCLAGLYIKKEGPAHNHALKESHLLGLKLNSSLSCF